jgi:hypothetical protein
MKYLSILLLATLTLLTGCSTTPLEPIDSTETESAGDYTITVISSEGDLDILQLRLTHDVSDAGGAPQGGSPEVAARPLTTIQYAIAFATEVEILIFEISGSEIFRLVEQKTAGVYSLKLNFDGRPSGVYVLEMQAADFRASKKLLLLK